MTTHRPRIFIGSATESLAIAESLNELLRDVADVTLWSAMRAVPGASFLEQLEEQIGSFDYGVFVLTGDDQRFARGDAGVVPRDNVILELGMFIGRHGRFKSFFVVPAGTDLKLPSDLRGISHVAAFDHERVKQHPEEAPAALVATVAQIKRNILPEVEDPVPCWRLLRSDTEMAGELTRQIEKTRHTTHEALVNWTIRHDQRRRDDFRNRRDAYIHNGNFDLRQVVMVHHEQQYREMLGMMRSVGSNLRYALRYVPATHPPLPLLNYWAFDLEDFFFEGANFDRARVHTTLALRSGDYPQLSEWLQGYFDDLWSQGSRHQLASGGEVYWDEAIELGTRLTVEPLTQEQAAEVVKSYRELDGELIWENADLVARRQ